MRGLLWASPLRWGVLRDRSGSRGAVHGQRERLMVDEVPRRPRRFGQRCLGGAAVDRGRPSRFQHLEVATHGAWTVRSGSRPGPFCARSLKALRPPIGSRCVRKRPCGDPHSDRPSRSHSGHRAAARRVAGAMRGRGHADHRPPGLRPDAAGLTWLLLWGGRRRRPRPGAAASLMSVLERRPVLGRCCLVGRTGQAGACARRAEGWFAASSLLSWAGPFSDHDRL